MFGIRANRLAPIVATALIAFGCNSEARTTEELLKENEALKAQVKELSAELTAAKAAKPAPVAQVAQAKVSAKKNAAADKPSPAEVEEAREQLTGGGSFK